MKRYKFLLLLTFLPLIACGFSKTVIPDTELKNYSTKKLLELGAGRYVVYDYWRADYYYNKLIELYPTNESIARAWATYEIGYIYYKKKEKEKAIEYFTKVLQINVSDNPSDIDTGETSPPHKLALKMIDIINYKPSKLSIKAKIDIGNDNTLYSKEKGEIILTIENKGKGPGKNIDIIIDKKRGADDILISAPKIIEIKPDATKIVKLSIYGRKDLKKGKAVIKVWLTEQETEKHSNKVKFKFNTQTKETEDKKL